MKEFGFRQIPDDGNYASHFSADLSTPKVGSAEQPEAPFADSRPAAEAEPESESDLIDLGPQKREAAGQGQGQGGWQGDQQAVDQAITGTPMLRL